jgi:hypothetical protein
MVGGTTLNARKTFIVTVGIAVVAIVSLGSALANQMAGTQITGHITAISGSEWIKIDAQNLRIRSGSQAAKAVQKMAPGQMVDVVLTGPPTAAASEVFSVTLHSGP